MVPTVVLPRACLPNTTIELWVVAMSPGKRGFGDDSGSSLSMILGQPLVLDYQPVHLVQDGGSGVGVGVVDGGDEVYGQRP